ncbi:MAG: hypothetical protein ACK4UU_04445 [Fimbriimonadales bacterium]
MSKEPKPFQRSWVTVVGWSPTAVVNTIWIACEQDIVPDRVVLLASPNNQSIQQSIETVKRCLRVLLPAFGVKRPSIEQHDIDEDDLIGFKMRLAQVLQSERKYAENLVLDVTAGRKYMSAFGLSQGRRTDLKLEKVYYNHLLEQCYVDVPHPLIPRHEQRLYDLKALLGD